MHQPTIDIYEREGARYAERRGVQRPERAEAFAAAVDGIESGAVRVDLGSGPGHYLPLLGRPAIAVDGALAMAAAAHQANPDVPAVVADLSLLPFPLRSLTGVWASKAHQHLRATDLPMALAQVQRSLITGARFDLTMFATLDGGATCEEVSAPDSGDDLPGRLFTWWHPEHLRTVVEAAGFRVDELTVVPGRDAGDHGRIEITATSLRALPDHVGADMQMLSVGLNPSLHSADAGIGYVQGSNRYWKAMLAAGLATVDRDPVHLYRHHRIGMTDLVKRPTPRADEVTKAEFAEGIERLEALCEWLHPQSLAIVGLAGWRAGRDRTAKPGWQPHPLAGVPVYVLPSTSGLNATTSLDQLVDHLRAAAAGPS